MSRITIYLDNDDYSKLSNPAEASKSLTLSETLKSLRSFLQTGNIEIRYSALNVMELIHLDNTSKPFAMARAQLLKEFANGNALVRPDLLYLREALQLARVGNPDEADKCTFASAGGNDWFGFSATELASNVEKILKEEFHQSIKERVGMPRSERRRLEKLFLTPDGKLTAAAIKLLTPHWEAQKANDDLPDFGQTLLQYCCGMATKQDYHQSFINAFSNMEMLVAQLLDYSPDGRKRLLDFILGFGQPFCATLAGLQDTVKELEENSPAAYMDKAFMQWANQNYKKYILQGAIRARSNILSKMYHEAKDILKKERISWSSWQENVMNSPLGMMPALDTTLMLTAHATYDRITDKKPITANDIRDFNHAAYAPYSDIFRADKRTADLFDKIRDKIPALKNTLILKKPEQIPAAIESLLQASTSRVPPAETSAASPR